jgi:hypothetical protein
MLFMHKIKKNISTRDAKEKEWHYALRRQNLPIATSKCVSFRF